MRGLCISKQTMSSWSANLALSALLLALSLVMGLMLSGLALAAAPDTNVSRGSHSGAKGLAAAAGDTPWRVRFLEAAVVRGETVLLGEVAAPVGEMPPAVWADLQNRELWLAPEEEGRPVSLTRPKLQQAVVGSLGKNFAQLCLYPPAISIQRGGKLYDAPAVQDIVVKSLTPRLAALPGEASLADFRLPGNVFVASKTQTLELEEPARVAPGRLSLAFAVRELDGGVARRLTGTVFIDCWAAVPCVTAPVNKGEVLSPEVITFKRQNLAYLRDEAWDGAGGPWQALRPIGLDQPILVSDISYVPTMKRGRVVNLVFESGNIRLSAKVEALADGVGGETIPVRNLQSKRQVYAVVQDENTVLARSGAVRVSQAEGRGRY